MNELTLTKTKKIIEELNSYKGDALDFNGIVKHVTCATKGEVAQVVEFLQSLQVRAINETLASRVDLETPIDLATELSYNYQVAKAILQDSLEQENPDKDDLRKTLTTIQKFMDSMLKMQEKVYNVQQMQRFQEAIMDVLQEHKLKDVIVGRLLELPL